MAQRETTAALSDLPLKSFETVCFHSLGLIERSCEYLELRASHDGVDEDIGRSVEDIQTACTWLDRSLGDMTSLLDCMRGTAEPSRRAVDMCALLRRIEQHKGAVKNKLGVTLKVNRSACVDPNAGMIHADAEWAERICLHLVSNALHACDKGGHIVITLAPEGAGVSLCVDDDGCGLPDGTQESEMINHRHFLSGAKCGLLLCREYCRLMSWKLELTPRDGKGTRARLTIPHGVATKLVLRSDDEDGDRISEVRIGNFFYGELGAICSTRSKSVSW